MMRDPAIQVHVEHVMGTVVSFHVRGPRDASAAVDAAVRLLHQVDARFSTYRRDSDVRRYDRGELDLVDSPELELVATACEHLRAVTGGAFDAQAGAGFDPSAYVKGWSVDRAGALLTASGFTDWSINAGGDVLVSAPRSSPAWRIGVQHPFDAEAIATVVHARTLAIATSGSYFRGGHILDPRTGQPATRSASTTVIGPSLAVADALSTAAFVLGAGGPALVSSQDGYECWTVLPEGQVLATSGFPQVVLGVPVSVDRSTTEWGPAA